MSLLNVHSELFLLNKSLIKVVFTYAVREIYNKLLVLFTNIPQFGSHPAIQTYIDVFCLREVFKVYTVDESKELIGKILKLIPTNSIESNKTLMSSIISKFQKDMEPYIVVFHAPPPASSVSVSFTSSTSSTTTAANTSSTSKIEAHTTMPNAQSTPINTNKQSKTISSSIENSNL
jgi:hypothetical protein